MLLESVGCISCAVVHSLRLDRLEEVSVEKEEEGSSRSTSELFIARVIRLERLQPYSHSPRHTTGELVEVEESRMPLVYFRKGYTTTAVAGTRTGDKP